MRSAFFTAALLSVMLFSCSKGDDNPTPAPTPTPTAVTPKAKEGTFLVDGIEYKPNTIQTQVDGEDYIIQGLASNGGLGLLQVRFGDKPAAGTYPVEPNGAKAGGFDGVTSGKFSLYTWGTETGSMAWTTDASTCDATVTINGNKMTAVGNDILVKRGTEDKTHTISFNFSAELK